MADIRIKDLATTATTTASDDFMAVDGVTNGTRKLSAATPAFLTSVTTPSLTSPAATNLTLAGGAGNSSIILTPAGTGNVGIGTVSPNVKLELGLGTISNVEPNQYLRVNAGTYNSAISANLDLLCWGNNFTNSLGWRLSSVNLAGVTTARDLTFNSLVDGGSGIVGAATERMRIASATGTVSISSTTAGSSGVGALVVQGGLATGAASYIGGALTVNADVFSFLDLPTGIFRNGSTGYISSQPNEGAIFSTNAYFGSNWTGTGSGAYIYLGKSGGSSQQKIFFGRTSSGSPTTAITFDVSTGAATFAGAVTIAGTVIHTLSATPASASATGTVGTMSWDASYIYICTAANTWKRVAIATW